MYNCPNCSGNLSFDIASQKLMCDYCKTQLDPYEYEKTQDAEENDMFGVTVFTCPQCGGEIMTTNVTAAGFCTYCGASTILDSRMKSEKRPAHIIPFTRTKEDCRKAYSSLVGKALFAPRELRDPEFLDRFRGIYIPYWVYNYSFNGHLDMTGVKSFRRGDYKITEHYSLSGEVNADYKGLTHDASSSFDDNVAAGIAPFEEAKLQPFTPSILCGFYADAPDVDSSVYEDDILDTISEDSLSRLSGVGVYRDAGVKMPSIDDFKGKLRGSSLNVREEKPVCAYLPVWFLTYRKNDRVAYAVMNGSTGKITADLPVDPVKYLLGSLLLSIPLFAVLAFFFTMTGQMVLTASSVLALVSLILYAAEISAISKKDSRSGDKGFRSDSDDSPEPEKEDNSGGKKMAAWISKIGGTLIWGAAVIFIVIPRFFEFLGSLVSDRLHLTVFKIYGGISLVVLLVVVICAFALAKTEMAKKNLLLQALGSILAVIASAAVLIWNPVSDLWFYGGSILAAIGVCLTFMGIIGKYNILATRPLPTFYDRKGGNDRAK